MFVSSRSHSPAARSPKRWAKLSLSLIARSSSARWPIEPDQLHVGEHHALDRLRGRDDRAQLLKVRAVQLAQALIVALRDAEHVVREHAVLAFAEALERALRPPLAQ